MKPDSAPRGFLAKRRARRAEKAAAKEKEAPPTESSARSTQARAETARSRRGGPVDVNKASFDQFRELGMSLTQATRLIAYRERHQGFASVDELEAVPGIPKKLLNEIRDQLSA